MVKPDDLGGIQPEQSAPFPIIVTTSGGAPAAQPMYGAHRRSTGIVGGTAAAQAIPGTSWTTPAFTLPRVVWVVATFQFELVYGPGTTQTVGRIVLDGFGGFEQTVAVSRWGMNAAVGGLVLDHQFSVTAEAFFLLSNNVTHEIHLEFFDTY